MLFARCARRSATLSNASKGTLSSGPAAHCTVTAGFRKPSETGQASTRTNSQPPISVVRSASGDGSFGAQQLPRRAQCSTREDAGQARATACEPEPSWPPLASQPRGTTPLWLAPSCKTSGSICPGARARLISAPAKVSQATRPCSGRASSGMCAGSAASQTHTRRSAASAPSSDSRRGPPSPSASAAASSCSSESSSSSVP
mmetsp:Transcript_12871/g.36633  ORF Transcript_12871/g.36633 Transcript_12871/m.36633 type:complete len:202 (-) Transcript_12871:1905-2510(-)